MNEKILRKSCCFLAVIFCVVATVAPSSLGNASIKPDTASMACLATTVYHEARGEPVKAQRAVAEVVLNRAWKSGKSVCEIVAVRRQFSWYKKHGIKELDTSLEKLLEEVFKQPRTLKNENFLFFYSGQAPYWATSMTCRPIGRLHFCKES